MNAYNHLSECDRAAVDEAYIALSAALYARNIRLDREVVLGIKDAIAAGIRDTDAIERETTQ